MRPHSLHFVTGSAVEAPAGDVGQVFARQRLLDVTCAGEVVVWVTWGR